MEVTLLKSFSAAANLKALLRSQTCPEVLRGCAPILQRAFSDYGIGTLRSDLMGFSTLDECDVDAQTAGTARRPLRPSSRPDHELLQALQTYFDRLAIPMPAELSIVNLCKIKGLSYADYYTTERNSNIYFRVSDREESSPIPAVIRAIVTYPVGQESRFLILVHRYLPPLPATRNPFFAYSGLGINIYSDQLQTTVEVVPDTASICHAIRRPWEQGSVILKPLNRVKPTNLHVECSATADTHVGFLGYNQDPSPFMLRWRT